MKGFLMREKQQLINTAEGMAIVRAIEASRPEGKRICYDPIARSLVSSIKFTLSKLVIDSGIYGRIFKGAIEFITARERYIDDFLKTCLSESLDQVVILGAGFDTRAYRIQGIEKTRVFEIDHPITQKVKLERLRKVIDPFPDHITFIPVDFNTQTLGECLLANGYNEQGKTLFIWQGVTMYLTPKGIDSTLTFVAHHSGPGSTVIFDYFYNETLHDMKTTRWITRLIGERLIFGIDQNKIEPFLTKRGFRNIHNVTSEDLKRLYFIGPNIGRPISTGAAIVSASVNKNDN